MPPDTAKRVTGRNCVLGLTSTFKDDALWPPSSTMVIACDFILQETWGPIHVQRGKAITVIDVLSDIYNYFQEPLTNLEVMRLAELHPDNYVNLVDAHRERCRRVPAIRGYERAQGLRRVDLFGDNRIWWGTCQSSRIIVG